MLQSVTKPSANAQHVTAESCRTYSLIARPPSITHSMHPAAGVSIERSAAVKDELTLTGNDVDLVSHSAALINGLCHVRSRMCQLLMWSRIAQQQTKMINHPQQCPFTQLRRRDTAMSRGIEFMEVAEANFSTMLPVRTQICYTVFTANTGAEQGHPEVPGRHLHQRAGAGHQGGVDCPAPRSGFGGRSGCCSGPLRGGGTVAADVRLSSAGGPSRAEGRCRAAFRCALQRQAALVASSRARSLPVLAH